eukprot:4120313-Amphidinium_carterae.1
MDVTASSGASLTRPGNTVAKDVSRLPCMLCISALSSSAILEAPSTSARSAALPCALLRDMKDLWELTNLL